MATAKIQKPTKEQYRSAAIETAFSISPDIRPCQKCGWPVVSGYCCKYCGDARPDEKAKDE